MANYVFESITVETLTGARDRVLDDLNALTDGNADKAIKYVAEFNELDEILKKHKQRQKEKAENEKRLAAFEEAQKTEITFAEMLANQ